MTEKLSQQELDFNETLIEKGETINEKFDSLTEKVSKQEEFFNKTLIEKEETVNKKFDTFLALINGVCEAIHVTGDTSTSNYEAGLYLLSNESASANPNNPVWKSVGGKRLIFNDESTKGYGWRIGKESGLADGGYYCKGDSHSLPITSEVWKSADPKFCGSNGSVQVQCTKIKDICRAIHVHGDNKTTNSKAGGLYHLSDERTSLAPNSPVWKNGDGSRYIFNTGLSDGWRIGQESGLATGGYKCKGGSQSLPIKSEVWSGGYHCGPNGTVQVKCVKTDGK